MPHLGHYDYLYQPGSSPTTLLLLHGTGGNEHDLLPIGQALNPTANILSLRGNVDEHGQLRFFKRLAEGVYDLADLTLRTNQLAEFIHAVAAQHQLDLDQMTIVGYSNGANIGLNLIINHPKLIQMGILFRPLYPLDISSSNLESLKLAIFFGQHDPIAGQSLQPHLVESLKQRGAEVSVFDIDAGHELTNQDIDIAKTWLQQLGSI